MKCAGAVGQPRWGTQAVAVPAAAPRWPAGERVPTRPRWTSTRGPSGAGSLESRRGEVPPGHRRLHKPSRGLAHIADDWTPVICPAVRQAREAPATAPRAEPTWSCWEFSPSPSHTPRHEDDHVPSLPCLASGSPCLAQGGEGLGFHNGETGKPKVKKKTPWTQGPKKGNPRGPTPGFLRDCKSQAGGSDMNKLPR